MANLSKQNSFNNSKMSTLYEITELHGKNILEKPDSSFAKARFPFCKHPTNPRMVNFYI